MVEIIKRGVVLSEVYECTCRVCRSVLSFSKHEATLVHDPRDGDYFAIECPVCENRVTVQA